VDTLPNFLSGVPAWVAPVLLSPFIGSFLGVLIRRLPEPRPVAIAGSTCELRGHQPGVLGALRLAGAPPVASAGTEAQVIAMTATAMLPDAPKVTRRAVVRFGYSPDGRGRRVLNWDDGEASSF
jgi:hypothetical protein